VCLEGLRKATKTLIRIVGVPANIQTGHFMTSSQKRLVGDLDVDIRIMIERILTGQGMRLCTYGKIQQWALVNTAMKLLLS
jgi:hypothetical protein